MRRVLLIDDSVIDRRVINEVLAKTFKSNIDVLMYSANASAIELVKEENIDLLIIDIPFFARFIDFAAVIIYLARKRSPGLSIIIASVTTEERISALAKRFDADGYLLKPYSGAQLASVAENLLSKPLNNEESAKFADAEKSGNADLKRYLAILENSIDECDYAKAKASVREYLELAYSRDNATDIRSCFMSFARGVAKLTEKHNNAALNQNLQRCLEQLSESRNIRFKRFESTELMIEMVDSIFVELEQERGDGEEFTRVLNYIELNIKRGITLDSVAKHFNMSHSYFSKFFKKNAGINFIIYVTNKRIETAKYMLQATDIPIINIAYELSYNDTNYFSKVFRKNVGLSPREYRQSIRKRKRSEDKK